MRAGKLRHKLTVENPTTTVDGQGGQTEGTPNTSTTIRASVVPVDAREQFLSQQFGQRITHKVRCRYTSAITHKSRLLFGSRKLHVVGVQNVEERGQELVVTCEEKS